MAFRSKLQWAIHAFFVMFGADLILSSLESDVPSFAYLLNGIFLSAAIKVTFLLYDQESKDLATTLLTTPSSSNHEWLTINVDSKLFGRAEYARTTSDQNLIITVLNDWIHWKVAYYKNMLLYVEHGNSLFVSNDVNLETDTIYKRLESLHQLNLFNAVFLHLTTSTVNCYTMKHHFNRKHELILIEISNNRSIFDQLFWNRYKQLDKETISVMALMSFPYLFLGKRRSKEMPEKYDYGVSGSSVYMAELMADYLNATLELRIHHTGSYKYSKKTNQFNFTTGGKDAYFVGDNVLLMPAHKLRQ